MGVGKIKPHDWLEVDVSKADLSGKNSEPASFDWQTVAQRTSFLAAQLGALWWKFGGKPIYESATGQFDWTSITPNDLLLQSAPALAHYYGPKAYEWGCKQWAGNNPLRTPPDNLIHLHNCLEQMQDPTFGEYEKARDFLRALSCDPKHFEIDGWNDEERKVLKGLVELIPTDGSTPDERDYYTTEQAYSAAKIDFQEVEQKLDSLRSDPETAGTEKPLEYEATRYYEAEEKYEAAKTAYEKARNNHLKSATKKTYELIHTKYRNAIGPITSLKDDALSLKALKAPFAKLFELVSSSKNGEDHFLKPLLIDLLQSTVQQIKAQGKEYILNDDEKKAFVKMCDDFDAAVKNKPIDEALKELFGQRIALIFGYKIPFTSPALKRPELAKPKRKKEIILEKVPTVAELKAETAKLQEECVEKGSLFAWHWLLVHVIGGCEDMEITPCIHESFESSDPMATFNDLVSNQLNSKKIPMWRRLAAKFVWYFTPLYSLTKFMMRRSIHATEKWFNEQLEAKQANQFDISEAKAVESTFKTWVKANKEVADNGSYEEEISTILANGKNRTTRVNKLTNVIVDTCFPAINLIGWCACCDQKIADAHLHVPFLFKPFVWVGSYPLRAALIVLKFALLAAQRVLNFIGRFFTKMLIKRLGIMQRLFDFRSRLQKGDHYNIETKLKTFFLTMIQELNATNFDTEPTDEELKRFNRVNHNVEQCAWALLDVLDMHETSNWSKEGIERALKGNFIEKEIRERVLPTVIEKGVVLFNEIYQEFILKPDKYELVRRNLYSALSESMTDTSPPPPEIDEEIKTEIHEFRTKVIRQIVLRTLAELGEDERKKAALYVQELQGQEPTFVSLHSELEKLKAAVGSQPDYDTSRIKQGVKKGLSASDATFKKYQRPLQSVYAKMSELYNGFLMPLQDIEAGQMSLDTNLSNVSNHMQIKHRFANLREKNWTRLKLSKGNKTLKEKAQPYDQKQIREFNENVGKLDYSTDKTNLAQARKRMEAFRDLQLCNQAIKETTRLSTLNTWDKARKQASLEHLLQKLSINKKPDDCIDSLNEKKKALEKTMKENAFSESPLDLEKQLGALKVLILEQTNRLSKASPYKGQEMATLLDTLVEQVEVEGKKTTPIERCYHKHNDPNHTHEESAYLDSVKDALKRLSELSPARFSQDDLSKWLDDKDAYDRIQAALKAELADLGKIDTDYLASHAASLSTAQQLLDECVNLCENSFSHWKKEATDQIDKMLKSTQKLIEQANDKTLSIPYFNFVYSADRDNDPVPIQMLIWFIGENAERTSQKVLNLSKHPVFLPWALRETALAAVAPVA